MAAPAMTFNQTLKASASLAANTSTTNDLDISSKFEAQIQVKNTGGAAVAATNGLRVTIWRNTSTVATPRFDTEPVIQFTIPTAVSTEKEQSFALPTGHYRIQFTNLDVTNAITVDGIYATVDTIA